MADKTRVLVLCTGNSARSQMAEAFIRRYGGDRFEVHSAGLEPKGINPFTLRVMQEAGYDLEGHRSKDLNEYFGKLHFGYIITVCSRAEEQCPIFPGVSIRLHWPFDDPAAVEGTDEEKLAAFRRVRDEIEAKVRSWLSDVDAEAR
ncbi:MAG: arsenate reductase ArsC [Anaerolineae bacterium]